VTQVGVLLEPTTIVAKAWEQIDRIGARAFYDPHVAVVTGAGPVGLLAALLAVQRGLEVHVFDRMTDGPKPDLVRDLGATYHATRCRTPASAATCWWNAPALPRWSWTPSAVVPKTRSLA